MPTKQVKSKSTPKRLFKSRKLKMIDGVCGGVAEYLGMDVTLVRILWLLSVLFNGLGLIAYVLAMIMVPANPDQTPDQAPSQTKGHSTLIWGGLFVVLGLFLFVRRWDFPFHWRFPMGFHIDPWFHIPWSVIWPVALIGLGIFYLIHVSKQSKTADVKKGNTKTKQAKGKRLTRLKDDKMVGGVCSGLARYWSIDSVIIRIGFVVLALATHVSLWIVLYLVLMVTLPQEKPAE